LRDFSFGVWPGEFAKKKLIEALSIKEILAGKIERD